MAFRPITKEYVQTELETYSQSDPAPEKGWAEIAKDDIVNTVSNYITGAQQGINELGRAQDAQYGNDLAQITSEQGYQPPTPQQTQYVADAQKAVMDETVLPTLALNPTTALPAIGTMLMGGAKDTYQNTEGSTLDKAGNAVRAITYGPAVDMYNDPNLAQRFYGRPVTTLTEGVLVAGQALLPVVGAKRGIAKAGEFKTDLARTVETKLNEITDVNPFNPVRGLDALDQIDSPTRGFRPATPDEAIRYNAEQRSSQGNNLVQALEQLKQQKFDQTEGVTPQPRFPERQQQQSLMNVLEQLKTQKFDNQEGIINQQRSPAREQQQALLQALERAKQQRFDEANQQSYQGFMERQQRESDALQTKKNEIASSVLFSPVDRMQVGADLPIKRSLGGQGKVLGENVTPSMLELPKPKLEMPQRAIEQPKKIPDAFDLVNQVQTKLFDQKLKDAVNKRDYSLAEQLADRMAKEGLETPLSKSVQSQKDGNRLYSGFDPTGGRFDNVDLGAKAKEVAVKSKNRIVNGLQDDRIIDNGRKWHEKGLKDLPPIKKVLQRVYQEVFDSLDPIARYAKEVYKSARLATGSAIGKAESMIRNKNNPDSFENIIKPVEDRLDDFAEYMVAKRAKELHATGTMTGVSNTKIAKILSEAPPEFAEVQKQLSSYSDRLVEMLVDSGMISEEHAINMFNKYDSYAPMMQAFDGEQISRMFQDKGDLGKPIKNIEGSDSKVINPIESILKNTYTFNMIAETNKVRQQIASLAESFPDEIKILKNGESAEKGTGTFDFFVDGKKMTMQLEPRLFEAIASMDSQQTSIVVKVLSKPASWLRAGATLSPEFLVKNLIRDTIGAGIVGKDFTPFVDSYKGLKSAWKKDQDYWDYKEAGGATGHLTGLDRNHLQEALDNYRAKSKVQKLSTAFNPKTWLEVLRKGQEIFEDATKLGYYKKRISKGDSIKEATFEARDLLDFSRSGNYTREANKVAAFLNASLQGTDKLVRSFKERPLETAANTMKYLIMPSMAVWYMQNNSDKKDEIQNLPRYVRDMFWIIPAGDKLIRIPKPFEPGMLFATGTERTLEAMFGNSKTPYKGYGESLADVTIPNILPTALVPLGEWWANKSFFTGQSIVPMKEQDLPDEMQYGPYTTNVAKFAGKVTGQSPRKIDNAIRGLTGGAGTAVTSTIDSITGGNTNRPAQTTEEKIPGFKTFIADPRKSQQSTQDFYDELDKYTKTKRAESVRGVKMTPNEKRNYEQLNNANTALKALNKEERKITESTKFSPEVKRQKLDKIIDAQTKLVQASLKRLK